MLFVKFLFVMLVTMLARPFVAMEIDMNAFWSALVQNLLMAFAPVLAGLLAAWLYAQFKLVWGKFKAVQPDIAAEIEMAASMAVSAAEQAGASDLIADKKAYAIMIAESWLKSKGLTVDLTLLDAAIEAAVYREINGPNAQSNSARLVSTVE